MIANQTTEHKNTTHVHLDDTSELSVHGWTVGKGKRVVLNATSVKKSNNDTHREEVSIIVTDGPEQIEALETLLGALKGERSCRGLPLINEQEVAA